LSTDHITLFDVPRIQAFSPLARVLRDVMLPERFQCMAQDFLLIQLQPF
jgi:hypothetical protein